jgi:hypothetical protein
MDAGPINWRAFDWQSFATLTTGFFAVVAAYLIGHRQTDIQRRQAKIQEAALRWDLFDRRYKVFERSEQFLREIVQHANDPSPETQRDFVLAMGESRFLFEPKVREGLDEIWTNWAQYHALRVTMKHLFQTEHHYGDGNPEKDRKALEWFMSRFTSLPDCGSACKKDPVSGVIGV